jgi:diguanylate cyclase (GGDEF)-like protein
MGIDATKHLERAKKYLEKNRLQDAVTEYKTVLEAYPANQEAIQALGDIYTRLNDPVQAAHYYGLVFDRLADAGDSTRAAALFTRFLKSVEQPPERLMRFAHLLQRQNKRDEAIEYFSQAADILLNKGNATEALSCWERIAALDPDNAARHVQMGEIAERVGRQDVAARGFLRAGQLILGSGDLEGALAHFEHAHRLAATDRSVALLYADALLRKDQSKKAVALLEPFPAGEMDADFLSVYGTALMQDGQLERARPIFEQFYRDRPDGYEKLFDLADAYLRADQAAAAVALLGEVKERMLERKRANDFSAQVDQLFDLHTKSTELAEFVGRYYDEQNRESKYFGVLTRLFDLYVTAGNFSGASSALDRIIDIDPYDPYNQARIGKLVGHVDPSYINSLGARMGKVMTGGTQAGIGREYDRQKDESAPPMDDEARRRQSLEDLLVQAEIFLQYSLHAKAVERLQKIAEHFPGEEENNARLRNLYELANWWPPAAKRKAEPKPLEVKTAVAHATGSYNADTLRDLGKISEITRAIHRQASPKAVLSTAVNEIGKYLKVTRCLAVIGPPGQAPQMLAEFCGTGVEASTAAPLARTISALQKASPDAMGVLKATRKELAVIGELGLESLLGAPLTDRETQEVAGLVLVGQAEARTWKPNESYFLQAVGDQVLIGVNHTKLRSLMRNLAVADEKTGLLGRSSYQDCLLSESNRSKSQNTPLSLLLLTLDKGLDLLRQQGEAQLERHMEQLARTLLAAVRQNDVAVKYTSWSLAFILPDTKLADAQALAEKLKKISAGLQPPWDGGPAALSVSVVEAVSRPDYDSEDIVTDLINRAEFGLETARKKGGDAVVSA